MVEITNQHDDQLIVLDGITSLLGTQVTSLEEVDVVLLHNVTDLVTTDGIVLDNISDLELMDESIQNDINNIEENFDNLEQFINGKGSFILVQKRFLPLIFVDAAVTLMLTLNSIPRVNDQWPIEDRVVGS